MRFLLKDWITLGNLTLACVAISLILHGRLEAATAVILLDWVLDGLDGVVARRTGTSNRFGGDFDNLSDLFIYSVAPALMVHAVYMPTYPVLAFILMTAILSTASIRLARGTARPLSYPGYWLGLPRPALGLTVVFFLSSSTFQLLQPLIAGAVLVLALSALNLSYLPYISNRAAFTRGQGIFMVSALAVSLALYPFGLGWDAGLALTLAYAVFPFWGVSRQRRADVRRYVAAWKTAPDPS